ncbi:Hypothetical predicted protein [Marmota monax]|uniref:Glycosyltransferase 2-like domain-containing protein n=1 Tax=Marmota monax TaxID=9995 RepID=A0A5E4AC99_MARMO|nr:hypothetical protein GHT09_002829 [Marmota monax]VTJ54828.1 Hypothetical predicted protein [Marmota monax]
MVLALGALCDGVARSSRVQWCSTAFPLLLTSFPFFVPRCKELKYSKELPQISIIFIFVNEALSVILRSVHSAVNHTPTHLLKEIILVDDNSDEGRPSCLRGPASPGWRCHLPSQDCSWSTKGEGGALEESLG